MEFDGVKYTTDDVVIINVHNADFLEVGLILQIVVKLDVVSFIINNYRAVRHPHLMFFETVNHDQQFRMINARELADYKALKKHGTVEQFRFVLHHHVTVTAESSQE